MKRFLPLLAALVLLLSAGLPAAGQPSSGRDPGTPFVFSPQWSAQAQFAGYYAALEKGFYDAEGLDVRIEHPFATQTGVDRLRSKHSHAMTLSLGEAMCLIDAGVPLVNILQTSMHGSLVLVSRYGEDPRKMHGASVATWRLGHGQIAQCMARDLGLDYEWVTATSTVNLFVSGAVDIALCTRYNELNLLRQTGLIASEQAILDLSGIGYDIQEEGVYMTRETFQKDAYRAQRFARASRQGWEWVAAHPDEALDIVMEYCKRFRIPTNRTIQKLMLEEVLRLQIDEQTGKQAFQLREDMVEQASDMLLRNGLIRQEVTLEDLR